MKITRLKKKWLEKSVIGSEKAIPNKKAVNKQINGNQKKIRILNLLDAP